MRFSRAVLLAIVLISLCGCRSEKSEEQKQKDQAANEAFIAWLTGPNAAVMLGLFAIAVAIYFGCKEIKAAIRASAVARDVQGGTPAIPPSGEKKTG